MWTSEREYTKFYWRESKAPTIDGASRLVILWRRQADVWIMRYMTVTELYRLQNMPLLEICEPEAYANLLMSLSMLQMVGQCGQAFHLGVMLVHFYCTAISLQNRLDLDQ